MDDEYIKTIEKIIENDEDYIKVIKHLKIANVNYAKNISKYTGIDIKKVRKILEELKELNIVEELHSKTVKRTVAKLKKQFQVRMHHTYYRLTDIGKQIYKILRDNDKI
ncbi:MAG: DUF2250 domain-containing protein [Nanopusillaceae archaeon]